MAPSFQTFGRFSVNSRRFSSFRSHPHPRKDATQKGVSTMSTEDNKATVRRWIEEGGNQGNVAVFDELSAPNWVYHDPNLPDVRTLADYKRSITEARSPFPDWRTTIEDLIAEGDQVVMRLTWRGTNTGDFVTPMPLPATGKQVTMTNITIVRFAGGKAVEVWNVGDSLGLFQQLGLIPAPGQAS
jgi:predicted ester cyclase